jgi:hypothetical protein
MDFSLTAFKICKVIILSVILTCIRSVLSDVTGRTWRMLEDEVWGA